LRPTGSITDNSHSALLTRRGLLLGMAVVALTALLSAEERPKRIVSTAPSITETLFALGLGDRVVGVSRFCSFPDSVQKLPKVGTYLAPDAEAIARLAPDLVVLQRISSELTERLNALHIRFIEVPHGTLDDVYTGIILIAKAAAVSERASVLNEHIQRELAALQARAKTLPSPRVLAIVNRRPGMLAEITAVGPDNYLERELSQRVSHLPQTVHADLPYTAEQPVAMGRYPHTDRWFESDEDHSFIREAMERTHCWEYRHRNFRSLSGGERQRVLLAVCDAVGRIVLPPAEIPAGAVLALIGGPYLVWAIRQRRPSEEI
jgi:hypothetical protein